MGERAGSVAPQRERSPLLRANVYRRDRLQRLKQGETVVIVAAPGETTGDEVSILRRQLLSAEEQAAVARFPGKEQQHDRVIARALVRLGLSRYFEVAPMEWEFGREKHQRPFVQWPANLPAFQFSLSHTRNLMALLVTTAAQGGVDLEQMERLNDLPLIATKICAASELESLNRLRGEAWKERFYELWTLKEAYAKARGLGLSLPWAGMAFETDKSVKVKFGSGVEDDPACWRFSLHKPTSVHVLASAVCGGDRGEIEIKKVQVRASEGASWLEP